MRHYERVIYCAAEWFFIEEVGNNYLLRSINRNIDDVLASPQNVKKFQDKEQRVRSKNITHESRLAKFKQQNEEV